MNVNTEVPVAKAGEETLRTEPIRIWLVDDNEQIRQSVVELVGAIEPRFCFEREFPSPEGLTDALSSTIPPNAILLDIQMGYYNGLDFIRPIREAALDTRVLMFTTLGSPASKTQAMREGASDFLLKCSSAEEIRDRIFNALLREAPVPVALPQPKTAPAFAEARRERDSWTHAAGWMRGVAFLRSLLGGNLTKVTDR